MKLISKNANLRVVLRPGMPAEPMTGRAAVPGLYAKFEDGVLESNDPEFLKILLTPEKGLGSDFIVADNVLPDPFIRTASEPEHDIMEIKYGHVEKSLNPKPVVTISPEMKKAIEQMAVNMAKEMAPKMAMELIKELKIKSETQQPQNVSAGEQKKSYEGREQSKEREKEAESKSEKEIKFCEFCDSKGVRHKKECTRSMGVPTRFPRSEDLETEGDGVVDSGGPVHVEV